MGCNYYAIPKTPKKCDCCSQPLPDEELDRVHIGKSSAGWKFMFHAAPDKYRTFGQLRAWLKDYKIVDEYGEHKTHEEFFYMVEVKQQSEKSHHAEYGNNNKYHHGYYDGDYEFSEGEFC